MCTAVCPLAGLCPKAVGHHWSLHGEHADDKASVCHPAQSHLAPHAVTVLTGR